MEELQLLKELDISVVIIGILILILCFNSLSDIIGKFCSKIGIEFSWIRRKNEERNLLTETNVRLEKLEKDHDESVKQSIEYDEKLQQDLQVFSSDLKEGIHELKSGQDTLTEVIKEMIQEDKNRDTKIDALMEASRVSLGNEINRMYNKYINETKGIPEDEVGEFTATHDAYNAVYGNHSGDAKYNYCIEHLSILPVSTSLVESKQVKTIIDNK